MSDPVALGALAVPSGVLVLVDDVPGAAPLRLEGAAGLWRVEGHPGSGADAGRWEALVLAAPDTVPEGGGRLVCGSGRLVLVDAQGAEVWFDERSTDGLADCVFRGRDAREAARALGAAELEGRLFGWRDLPASEARRLYKAVVFERDERGLSLEVEERPHAPRRAALDGLCESPHAAAVVDVGGRPALLVSTTWGPCGVDVAPAADGDGVRIAFAPNGTA